MCRAALEFPGSEVSTCYLESTWRSSRRSVLLTGTSETIGLPNIDADLLNGIVPIAEPIPLWRVELRSASHIRRSGGNHYRNGPLMTGDELPPLPTVSLPFAH